MPAPNLIGLDSQVPVARREGARANQENRALLSVVFVAVAMIGPVFTIGYGVGRLAAPRGVIRIASASEPQPEMVNPPSRVRAASKKAGAGVATKKSALASRADQPDAGQVYLQLFATAEDQDVVDQLRSNGFRALASEVPEKPGLHRILVGPLPADEVSKTRAELQSKGFPGESAITRTISVNRTF